MADYQHNNIAFDNGYRSGLMAELGMGHLLMQPAVVAHYFTLDAATLTTTSNGGFSGTFFGKSFFAATYGPYTAITNGKFTNLRP